MAKPIPLVVKDLEDEFEEIEQKALGMVKDGSRLHHLRGPRCSGPRHS